MREFLHTSLIENNHIVSSDTEEKFIAYLTLLQKWNRVHNLTAIRDEKQSVLLHILDSLSIQPYLHGHFLIDVGTGAGLPGIPLALTCPDHHFVLLDSNSKKIRFLSQVLYELQLKNVEIVHARCENFNPEKKFDSILSRAFASIQVMLATTQHLLSDNGQCLAMKGAYPEKEIREIIPPFHLIAIHPLRIKGLEAERHLICVGKS